MGTLRAYTNSYHDTRVTQLIAIIALSIQESALEFRHTRPSFSRTAKVTLKTYPIPGEFRRIRPYRQDIFIPSDILGPFAVTKSPIPIGNARSSSCSNKDVANCIHLPL